MTASMSESGAGAVAVHPVSDTRLECRDDRRRRGEVHVGDPERQDVLRVEVPLEAGAAAALDRLVEVHRHLPVVARAARGGPRSGRLFAASGAARSHYQSRGRWLDSCRFRTCLGPRDAVLHPPPPSPFRRRLPYNPRGMALSAFADRERRPSLDDMLRVAGEKVALGEP